MSIVNNRVLLLITYCVMVLSACDKKPTNEPSSAVYNQDLQSIEINEVFSKLITRDSQDNVYSGQIKSEAGLVKFEAAYGITLDHPEINFEKEILIFGITDDISTRATHFFQDNRRSFILDYIDLGIEYKLTRPEEGKKYSYLQVFLTKKRDDIPHIRVKNLIRGGLSHVYDK